MPDISSTDPLAEIERLRGLLKRAGIDASTAADRNEAVRRDGQTALALAHADTAALRKLNSEISTDGTFLRAVLDSSTDYAIIALNLDGLVTVWNRGAEAILNWPEAEMLGRSVSVFFTDEDIADDVPAREMRAARERGQGRDERYHRRRDGSCFWASGLMMPLRTEGGDHVGYLKILRDRTAQRALEVSLQRQTDVLQTVTDHVSEAVFQLDLAGRVQFANPASAAVFGWSADELLGRSLHDVLHHSHADGAAFEAGDCPLVQAVQSGESLVQREDLFFHRDGHPVNVVVSNVPVRTGGDIMGAVLTVVDTTERRRFLERQTALIEIGDRLRELDTSADMSFATAEILGRTLGVSRAGYGTVDLLRQTVTVENDWAAPGEVGIAGVHSTVDFASILPDLTAGRNFVVDDIETDPRTRDALQPWRNLNVRACLNVPVVEHGRLVALLFLHDGAVRHWSQDKLTFIRNVADRTRAAVERVRAEERQRLLNQELNHRLKNILAMVQAIASQTMRSAPDVRTAQETLSARLIALGHAHDILLSGAREAAPLATLVRSSVRLHDGEQSRFRLAGPKLEVGSRAALSLALMLHELATNAAKYGALSVPEGRVDVTWSISGTGAASGIHLTWQERGGPPVTAPSRKGFGSRLIERGLAGQIGGTVALDYAPDGLVCKLDAPLTAFQADEIHPERKRSRAD